MKKRALNRSVCIAGILLTLISLELGARAYKKDFNFKSYRQKTILNIVSSYPPQYDPYLGWIPKPGFLSVGAWGGAKVSIGPDGIRSNGEVANTAGPGSPPILAVGDSFTFGGGVADDQTWPAILERLSGKRVINGGVFGYGIDQSFLRAEILVKKYKPGTLIFSFIPDDIRRCQYSRRMGTPKPYFDISGNGIILKNVPVPRLSGAIIANDLRDLLSRSLLIDRFMMRLFPVYWIKGSVRDTVAHHDGERVASLLLHRLTVLAGENGAKNIYILVQYNKEESTASFAKVERVLDGINNHSVHVIDLKHALKEVEQNDKARYDGFYNGHMSYEGNYFVASVLKEAVIK